uniref:Uncharacterized protein n=1 Tax=Anaerobacillus isosaccharinicus TaxID=1532552 RepID=A0A1S2LHJ2_9BACI
MLFENLTEQIKEYPKLYEVIQTMLREDFIITNISASSMLVGTKRRCGSFMKTTNGVDSKKSLPAIETMLIRVSSFLLRY